MSPKITKLYIEKGKTKQIGETQWDKTTYGLEYDVSDVENEERLDKLRTDVTSKLDDWLEGGHGVPGPAVDIENVPEIDLAELDDAGWKLFNMKEPAKPGQTAWHKNPVEFTSWKDPPKVLSQLVKLMRLNLKRYPGQPLVLGDMQYTFSGKGDMKDHFIKREPRAAEKATESKPSKTPKKAKPGETSPLHTVRQLFQQDLEELLNFAVEGAFIVIKPRQYLGSDNFAKIAAIVREAGGSYQSQGKDSHFRIKVSDIKK